MSVEYQESKVQLIKYDTIGGRSFFLAVYAGRVLGTIMMLGSTLLVQTHPVVNGQIRMAHESQQVDSVQEAFEYLLKQPVNVE